MIEATYPLSPSQKGMLFETLASRRAGLHVEQAVITLRGHVDAGKFAAAWRDVARRHPILRTRFRWEGLDEPLQDVHDDAPIDFHVGDDASELNRYVEEDRQRSFDLAAGPLLRVALFRGSDGTHQSVWTTHHILLDGWSVALVVRDLVACYDGSNDVAAPRPYGDYIEWLRTQDQGRAEQYWRAALQGVDCATPLGDTNGGLSRATGFGEKRILFSRKLSDSLRLLMRRNRLPLNTLFQAMWALLLKRYSGQTNVIFGATVAGRPPQLAGIESMAGLFINTVPVAVDVDSAATFPTWLHAIHEAESERAQFDYCSTGQIRAWSGAPLFDSVLVFENYPHAEVFASKSFTVDVATSRSIGANTRFPLNLIVEPGKEPGKEIALTAIFDQSRLGAAAASCIANDFVVLAEKIDASPDITVAALLEAMRSRPIPAVYAPPRRLDDTPPRTPAEAKVAAICAEAIGIDHIGVRENFFDLGGHSLMAAQVIRRLRDAFSAELPLRLIFDHPTVEEITRALAEAIDAAAPAATEPIPRANSRDRFPPSFQQERLWFVDQLEGGSSAYNAQAALRIDGDLAVPMLQNALDEIVRRHEILRTVFRAEDGRVSQIVLEPFRMAIPVTTGGRNEIEALAVSEILEPFDLASAPLLRFLLVRTGDREHVLIVTMHHIVTDGWSNSIFFRELAAIYDAFAAGGLPALPLPRIQYGDYAAWQRASIDGPEMERLLSYWKTALDGAPPRLDLPACLPRPPKQEGRGAVCAIELPAELSAALRRSAERTTLFMTLLAALDVLLFRLSGQDDIVVGTPIANRERAGTEGLIGFFVNTLALRTSLAGRPTFRELLRRVRATALDAYAHQQMPFERLVEALKPERDLSRNPLFQIFLNVLNVPPVTLALGDLEVRPFPLPELVTRFDLTLYAIDNGDAICLEMLYDTALFRADDVERMLAQLRLILDQIAIDPDVAIDACSLVGSGEWGVGGGSANLRNAGVSPAGWAPSRRPKSCGNGGEDAAKPAGEDAGVPSRRLTLAPMGVGGGSKTVATVPHLPHPTPHSPLPPGQAIHDGFRATVARAPERIAVVDANGSWTYGQLGAMSGRVANDLLARGIGNGAVVAIEATASASLIGTLIGVLESGAAFVILDTAHPLPRRQRIVDIVRPAAILTLDLPSDGRDDDPLIAVGSDDVAYIAFTSGSTGEPLGIIGTHRPVTHFLEWHIRTFGLNENDRFSLLSGLSHDPFLRDVFTPLSLGASLHIPPPGVRQSDDLAPWMRDSAITVAHLTPAIGEIVCSGTTLPSLRWAFFGGDVLRRDLVRRFRDRAPSCRVVNFYGATETPQAMAFHILDDVVDDNFGSVPIGRGIDGVELLLLNEAGILAGVGEVAEICVRTPYLSRGYLNAASSDRFQNDHTIYRTGDVGRYRADGNVEVAGRKGRQLKIRGVRIEPREIEAVLEQHLSIREAVVIGIDDVLTACVVPWSGAAIDSDDCRRFAAARLPDSFTPAEIVIADSIPLTPNGKADHAAIARLAHRTDDTPVALADDLEHALASIWEEVLGIANVCATSNFFTLGGHSLKATRVVSRIQRDLGVAIPLRELFRAPVLRDLANVVRAARPEARRPIEPIPRAESYAVSHAQRRLWTLAQLAESAAAYSLPRALLLDGDLDAAAFARAMRDLVARHESLRTTFATIDGELRQTIDEHASIDVPLSVPLLDLTAGHDPLARAVELAREDAARPFDLDRGPLLRVSLLRLAGRQHALLFNAHHIVVDAWSIDVLVRELGIAYAAHAGGTVPLMAPLRIQYRDYAAWQNAMLASDQAYAHRLYWREKLAAPLPVLELPLDFARPPVKSYNGRRIPFSLTVEESDALSTLARANDVSLYMLLVAIVKLLLHRYSGCDDVIVGAPVAGRNDADLENQIGFFVNMLPLRDHIDDQPFTQLLRDVARTATEAYDHQQVPFDSLIADLNVARETSRSPLFDVVVVLQNAERSELRLGDVRIEPFPSTHQGSKFDLNFTFQEEGHRLTGFVEYNTDLWRDDRAARAVTHFRELVQSIVTAPEERIARLNLLPEAERRLVVEELNATDASYPQLTIHALFDQRALAQPDDVAVIFRDRQMTYGELRRGANALAHTLRARYGVAAGDRVGVVLERSEQVIVALLAVLKAGAAYVPIDPSYPPERIRFILDDADCCVVIDDALMNGLQDDGEVSGELEPAGRPDDAAYVIYTSGSTGKPKGCVVTHRNVVRLLVNDRFRFDFTRDDVWIVAHSFAFDFSVWEMYGALLYGGRLVVAARDDARNPAALHALLRRNRVTILNQTPASFYALIDHERGEAMHDLDSHLRIVIFGGDRLDPVQLRPWTAIYPLERVQLVNMYGITETTVHVTYGPLSDDDITGDVQRSPIGVPLPETRVYICGSDMTVQPLGVAGELYIGGSGVCRGYWNRPELTAQRFVPSPFREGEMLYRTGDTGRWLSDGTLEYVGRNDNQVQIRGFRVELGEIERVLASHHSVRSAVVRVWQPDGDARDVDKRLVAYVVGTAGTVGADDELRAFAKQQLPDYMVPSFVVPLDAIPLTSNGKIDARALPPPATATITAEPHGDLEHAVASIWREVLHRDDVSAGENFFDLGGHSLLLVQVHRALRERLHSDIPLVDLFRFPTVRAIAQRLRGQSIEERPATIDRNRTASNDIAVIGMAGRFPGAPDVETFWRNLCDGVEASAPISDDALRAAGVPQSLIDDPRYVKRKPLLDGIEEFDPAFFGISPREAAVMDPQHRLFLECAWEALENAGYDSERCDGRTGVFGGISFNGYLLNNLLPNREALESLGAYPVLIGNDRDFVTTRVSYKLNLRGPSINVSTACSTSLVAVHLACRALIERQCDMALAGGASVKVPQHEGYLYDEGGILSPDGRCRAFDAEANGTVGGSGAGIVVLKRLDDAQPDGDVLLAIIKGSAIGNDGSDKIGYSAPSLTGQATVIAEAHLAAGVEPESIGYVEAHGTGTSLGDPIEIAALTQAFRARTSRNGFCAIGSVKTNIGHLDAAAGVTGLIKTVLALQRKRIPPSLNYRAANPNIDFASTPFVVNTALTEWTADKGPRRAGVSSFGLGGTNVHVILEEAPQSDSSPAGRDTVLLPVSARTSTALTSSIGRLAAYFADHSENIHDAAYTLAVGRRAFPHRAIVVCGDANEAAELLRANDPRRVLRGQRREGERRVAFLFPGGGAQHARMGQRLYESEPRFREELDRCATILRAHLGPLGPRTSRPHAFRGKGTLTDIRDHLASDQAMVTTSLGLPALFAVEYALARLWMSWGIVPRTMLGHSLGEYVAACLAGVFSLDDALALVALRGRLFETIEPGEMVSVPLSEEELKPFLDDSLSIAAINHPAACVVSGPLARIDALVSELSRRDIDARRLHISVAAHSSLVDPILEPFHDFVAGLSLHAPEIPFVSNVTGDEITPQQATDPRYWSGHLRHTVRFGDGVATLLRDPETVLLEVGPGTTLTSLAQRHPARLEQHAAIASMRHPNDAGDDVAALLTAAGRLWIEGAPIDWTSFYRAEPRRRVTLPGAVFERTRCWIDAKPLPSARAERNADVAKWFYAPSWKRIPLPPPAKNGGQRWLLLGGVTHIRQELAAWLRARGENVIAIDESEICSGTPASSPAGLAASSPPFAPDFGRRDGALPAGETPAFRKCSGAFDRLLAELNEAGALPDRVIDCWAMGHDDPASDSRRGFYALLNFARAWRRIAPERDLRITVVTTHAHDVSGDEPLQPEKSLVFGLVKVLGQECARIRCNAVDLVLTNDQDSGRAVHALKQEVMADESPMVVAWRGGHRWALDYEPLSLDALAPRLRENPVILITGGTGGVGLYLARHLAGSGARLVLAGRNARAADISTIHGDVLLVDADVAVAEEIEAAVAQTIERFGALHGVIHAAGITRGNSVFRLFDELSDDDCETQFRPKVDGVRALAAALAGRDLDFVLLMSSNASVLGGLGLAAYASANQFLDAFAAVQNRSGSVPWISANWDGWPTASRRDNASPSTSIDRFAMDEREAFEAFRFVAGSAIGQVVVSSGDLRARLDRWTKLGDEPLDQPGPVAEIEGTDGPRNSVERSVAALWREMLGVPRLGIFDNFFELRGDSLLGTRLITRLDRQFGVRVPLRALFEDPTVAGLAERIERLLGSAQPSETEVVI
jgi:amino acid adenylation domain-containing protein